MKRSVVAVLLVFLVTLAGPAQAAPIPFWSGDGGDVLVDSVVPGAITTITPHPAWGDVSDDAGLPLGTAEWISYANTGIGGITAPNVASRTVGNETMHIRRTFDFPTMGSLELHILADDTVEFDFTGPLFSFNQPAFLGQLDPCAPGGSGVPVGCVEADMGHYLFPLLTGGTYTLDMYFHQTNGSVFGGQYAGNYDPAPIPEPATLLTFGFGTTLLGMWRRKQKQN